MTRLRVLTWHVHGNYLWYLSRIPHDIFLPVRPGAPEGHGGRGGRLVERMGDLLGDRGLAGRLGAQARLVARERFSIDRFAADRDATLGEVAGAR